LPTTDAIVPKTIHEFLVAHHIDNDAQIAVAFSGGSDSLALLLGLSCLLESAQALSFELPKIGIFSRGS